MGCILPPVAPHISAIEPYRPGKSPEELEKDLGITGAVKLASNENPLGPPPRAVEALVQAASQMHRYPDGAARALRRAIARHHGLDPAQVCVTNGSNEVIELVCRAFVRPGVEVLAPGHSFLMYAKLVAVAGGNYREVPLKEMRVDLEALSEAVGQATGVIFVTNPHNPAGTAITAQEFEEFLSGLRPGVVVVLDEAYMDFASDPAIARGEEFLDGPVPVVVMRTFSKSYALAGARIGYALAPREVIEIFDRVRQPFNTSSLAQAAALGALEDKEFLERTRELVASGRGFLEELFTRLGLEFIPSQANFVLVRLGPRAGDVAARLMSRGVIVRAMGGYGLGEYLRVSIGTWQELERFAQALEATLGELEW